MDSSLHTAPASELPLWLATASEPFDGVSSMPMQGLLDRIGNCRIVLLGEASHGTSEFYRARERITRALIQDKGFNLIALEGDWPDVARLDHYVRHANYPPSEWTAFSRFPTWMWRNEEVRQFIDWLHDHNLSREPDERVGLYGLDLYSLYGSIRAILEYLDDAAPEVAKMARDRYRCLMPFENDPRNYSRQSLHPEYQHCEQAVLSMLKDLQSLRQRFAEHDGSRFLNAVQNARLVANAEHYYRTLFYATPSAWNLRDSHMFETLQALLEHHGKDAKVVVWAHNSHLGGSDATDMSRRGEYNLGHLCRHHYGDAVYSVGFGTDHGTVAAVSDWDEPLEIKTVQPALEHSYEALCHHTGVSCFMLPLRKNRHHNLVEALRNERLERAIGVIYRPRTERQSHYFHASLPEQFDEYIWFEQSEAITPLSTEALAGVPDTYPFGF